MATKIPSETASTHSPSAGIATVWHKSAPKSLHESLRSEDASGAWAAWSRHLAKRRRPKPPGRIFGANVSPLSWALPEEAEDSGTVKLVSKLNRLNRKLPRAPKGIEPELLQWLAESSGSGPDPGFALESLAWCYALPGLAAVLAPDVWWLLLDHLTESAGEANQISLPDEPLVHQLLAGELPLTLAYLFPEIKACRKLLPAAHKALSTGLLDLLDGEGLPDGKHLALLRPLLACWTRCGVLGAELTKGCWNKSAQTQYEWLVRTALRLTRHDGSHVLSNDVSGAWCKDLFDAALCLGGDSADYEIAQLTLPSRGKPGLKKLAKTRLPKPAYHSEWATTGVLRQGWQPNDSRLIVVYDEREVKVEFESRRQVVWSGNWDFEVRCDGELIQPKSNWEEVCWFSDDDVDYLELEVNLGGQFRLQRHMLLARKDQFLLMADSVLGSRPAVLEYRGSLPLCKGMSILPSEETHESCIRGRKNVAMALPLALSEWRAAARNGSLCQTERGLELSQSLAGSSMFAPIFFDLKPGRMNRPLTWRQLTVAADLEIQPPDVAVGYRVMVGRQQWLIYRSLGPVANRTLLGHNLSTEMLVARFDRSGQVKTLLEIE